MKISGNKGEWSELYVLIRLLADGKIYYAREDLTVNEDCYLPILKIFCDETEFHHVEYHRNDNENIELYFNGAFIYKISTAELESAAKFFFDAIIHGEGKGAFEIQGAENFMEKLKCQKIKADSAKKADITLEVHDPFINYDRICAFSIKSNLGNAPTLFNASQGTNFKFEVFGVSDDEVDAINAISTRNKVKDRISKIEGVNFVSVLNEIFAQNLKFIDTQMEKFIAKMLKIYYCENVSDCAELAKLLEQRDPFNFNVNNLYQHKLKKFLCAVALGFKPTKIWDGMDKSNGGYIIVKENGEVLAYHLYNRDEFERYLLNNTKLDTASTSRHKFGKIYVEGDKKFINLNLQIRFK